MTDLILIKQTITSMEVAEMFETQHKTLLRKIEGRNSLKKPVKGYIQILAEHHLAPSDYFIPSEYRDSSGKLNKCYCITKSGCEFLSHKFTGEKGVVFTARYINRFHDMENALKTQNTTSYEVLPGMSKSSVPKISSWYTQNKDRIARICEKNGWKNKELYHKILEHVGQTYNIGAAKKIYKKENGFYPPYVMDVVGYFPELAEMANDFLNELDI